MTKEKPTYEELERQLAEIAEICSLQEFEGVSRLLADATTDAAFLLDLKGKFMFANLATAKRLETSLENLMGKPFTDFIPKEVAASRTEYFAQVVKNKKPQQHVDVRNGRTYDNNVFPIIDENGKVYRIAVFSRDITRELAYEQELLDSRHYLNEIFNGTLSGVIVVDAQSRIIADINSTALEMLSRSKDEVVGKVCHNFVCPAEKGKCPIGDLGQTVDKSERILLTADKGQRAILKSVKPMAIGGKEYYIESFIDITELKIAESQREKLIVELKEALDKVKVLSGLMPICSKCKKIRDDKGYWNNLESYIEKYSEASFSHGMCPECSEELYGEQEWYQKGRQRRKDKQDKDK